jgi:hypothetical protein
MGVSPHLQANPREIDELGHNHFLTYPFRCIVRQYNIARKLTRMYVNATSGSRRAQEPDGWDSNSSLSNDSGQLLRTWK